MAGKPKPLTLSEFLSNKNLPSALGLPWIHSASASNLMKIIDDEKLLALSCNVFKGEKLCYLFIGRPAYKIRSIGDASGQVIGRIFRSPMTPDGWNWFRTITARAPQQSADRGYASTREEAMTDFKVQWAFKQCLLL